jgi:hypothetical protein
VIAQANATRIAICSGLRFFQLVAHCREPSARWLGTLDDFRLGVLDARQDLPKIAHVDAADRAIAEVVVLGLSDAV